MLSVKYHPLVISDRNGGLRITESIRANLSCSKCFYKIDWILIWADSGPILCSESVQWWMSVINKVLFVAGHHHGPGGLFDCKRFRRRFFIEVLFRVAGQHNEKLPAFPPPSTPRCLTTCNIACHVRVWKSRPMEPFQCPDEPPTDYPKGFPAMDVINHWNPDETDKVPDTHYLSTCR